MKFYRKQLRLDCDNSKGAQYTENFTEANAKASSHSPGRANGSNTDEGGKKYHACCQPVLKKSFSSKVILTTTITTTSLLVVLLFIFCTTLSESATLGDVPASSRSSHIIPHTSYLYQIPQESVPRVLLRLNSETGTLKRAITTRKASTTTTTPTPLVIKKEEDEDYPYHIYLDFDEDAQKDDASVEESLPVASSLLYPPSRDETLHNNIWSDYYIKPQPQLDSFSDQIDNYTIPSLRNYKFPEFKSTPISTTTTPIPNYFAKSPHDYSDEDLDNVADLDDQHVHYDHSKYFVKTKPRDVSSSLANLYNSFYYEPPSYSTKTQHIPVKAKFPLSHETDKLINFFTSSPHYNKFDVESIPSVTPPMTPTEDETSKITGSIVQPTSESTPAPETTVTTPIPPTFNLMDSPPAESILASVKSTDPTPSSYNSIIPTDNTHEITTSTDATSIPGMPGIDYPIFGEIPITDFDCQKQRYKGFFADIETKCQAWHYCDFTDGHKTFLCPNGTLFSQVLLTCDWWFNVDCIQAQQLYVLNERLYRYIKPPKPSFPEDYHGPQVDLWLLKQLELGLLPKIKKKGRPPPLLSTTPPNSTKDIDHTSNTDDKISTEISQRIL